MDTPRESNSRQHPAPRPAAPPRSVTETSQRGDRELWLVVGLVVAALSYVAGYGQGAMRARPTPAGVGSVRTDGDGGCEARCAP